MDEISPRHLQYPGSGDHKRGGSHGGRASVQSSVLQSDINSDYQIQNSRLMQNDLEMMNIHINRDNNGFIRKVYAIFLTQVLATTVFVTFTVFEPSFGAYQQRDYLLEFICAFVYFTTSVTIFICRDLARQVPLNYMLLSICTVTQAYMLSSICSSYTPSSVLTVFVMASCSFLGMTFYAFNTTQVINVFYSLVYGTFMLLITLSILIFFTQSSILLLMYSSLATFLSMAFVAVDVQMIIDGQKYNITCDDYILASLMLYVDFINMFIHLLQLFGQKK